MRKVIVILLITLVSVSYFVGCSKNPKEPEVEVNSRLLLERGEYLAKSLSACGFCHGSNPLDPSSPLSGGRRYRDTWGETVVPNITPDDTGIKGWRPIDVVTALRSSHRYVREEDDYEPFSPEPHKGYEWMSDDDAYSIAAHVLSGSPVSNITPRRTLGFMERNITGVFRESPKLVRGYVPSVNRSNTMLYGKYLTDHVARCGGCHNSPAGIVSGEEYLAGGKEISFDGDTRIAPSLLALADDPMWSEVLIAKYLRTGETPDGRIVSNRFCPVSYYRLADPEDIAAIAIYLRKRAQ